MTSQIKGWAKLAVVDNIVFLLAWVIAATWQGSNYSTVAHTISDMYADGAPGAWVLIVIFTLCGAGVILFAFRSLRPALRDAGRPATIGAILLALSICGLGDLLSIIEREGCRLADAGCTAKAQLSTFGGTMDATLSNIGVVLMIASGYFLAVAMKRLPAWRSWFRPAIYWTSFLLLLCLLDAILGSHGLSGFFERLIAITGAAGIIALAVGTLRRADRSAATPATITSTR